MSILVLHIKGEFAGDIDYYDNREEAAKGIQEGMERHGEQLEDFRVVEGRALDFEGRWHVIIT